MERHSAIALALVFCFGPVWACAATIHVKILVDEEEPMVEHAWRQRLQTRLDNASAVISQCCGLKFSVTCFDRWSTDNNVQDFSKTLREFEQEVSPEPAQLAIGFTSQFQFHKGGNSLGGTRGPLHSHILIREGSRTIYEAERLEVVVHELGHYLGAAHSGRSDSVMRPVLGDGQSRARAFRIGFDRDNAEIIRLVSREVMDLRVRRFAQLTPVTKLRMRQHYMNLAREAPDDGVAKKYVAVIDKMQKRAAVRQGLGRYSPLGGRRRLGQRGTKKSLVPRQVGGPNASALPR